MKQKNKYYSDGVNAPIELQQRISYPDTFDRGAKRRFVNASKKGGLYYCHDDRSVTLAFSTLDEKTKSVQYFRNMLSFTGRENKMK